MRDEAKWDKACLAYTETWARSQEEREREGEKARRREGGREKNGPVGGRIKWAECTL